MNSKVLLCYRCISRTRKIHPVPRKPSCFYPIRTLAQEMLMTFVSEWLLEALLKLTRLYWDTRSIGTCFRTEPSARIFPWSDHCIQVYFGMVLMNTHQRKAVAVQWETDRLSQGVWN